MAFADRIHRHFFNVGALTTNAVIQSWMRRAAQLDTAIVAESARWGDSMPKQALSPSPYPAYRLDSPYNRNEDWLGEQTRLLTSYFPNRSNIVLDQLRAAGLYPNVAAPVFHQHGKARVRSAAGEWSALNEADFQVAELGCRVRITEIMTRPAGAGSHEHADAAAGHDGAVI